MTAVLSARIHIISWFVIASCLICACDGGSERDPCEGVTCSGHGECLANDEAATCVCFSGYEADELSCVPAGSDGDADGDADVDGDGDGDGDCPVNSGYPCQCDGTAATCEDGSDCLAQEGAASGFCSLACDEQTDPVCASEYGIPELGGGACVVVTPGSTAGDHCAVICEYLHEGTTYTGACPPGLSCTVMTGGSLCM